MLLPSSNRASIHVKLHFANVIFRANKNPISFNRDWNFSLIVFGSMIYNSNVSCSLEATTSRSLGAWFMLGSDFLANLLSFFQALQNEKRLMRCCCHGISNFFLSLFFVELNMNWKVVGFLFRRYSRIANKADKSFRLGANEPPSSTTTFKVKHIRLAFFAPRFASKEYIGETRERHQKKTNEMCQRIKRESSPRGHYVNKVSIMSNLCPKASIFLIASRYRDNWRSHTQ